MRLKKKGNMGNCFHIKKEIGRKYRIRILIGLVVSAIILDLTIGLVHSLNSRAEAVLPSRLGVEEGISKQFMNLPQSSSQGSNEWPMFHNTPDHVGTTTTNPVTSTSEVW